MSERVPTDKKSFELPRPRLRLRVTTPLPEETREMIRSGRSVLPEGIDAREAQKSLEATERDATFLMKVSDVSGIRAKFSDTDFINGMKAQNGMQCPLWAVVRALQQKPDLLNRGEVCLVVMESNEEKGAYNVYEIERCARGYQVQLLSTEFEKFSDRKCLLMFGGYE